MIIALVFQKTILHCHQSGRSNECSSHNTYSVGTISLPEQTTSALTAKSSTGLVRGPIPFERVLDK